MLTSLASIQLESDSRRFGNPNRFIPVGKCSSAKLSLSKAVEQMTTGTAASSLSEAQLSRLKALSDQNTGCQNSGCGGAEAALAAKAGGRK